MGNGIILYSHLMFQDRRLESDGTICSKNHPNEETSLLSHVARGSSLNGCCANGMTSVPGWGTVAVFGIGACRCPYGHRSSPIG
ncbi:hypothetical protein TNCV_1064371 [Trichonephila clavipes]|nr:hypothetical protein TNCV_1064371 [Trichonephila clavipes]